MTDSKGKLSKLKFFTKDWMGQPETVEFNIGGASNNVLINIDVYSQVAQASCGAWLSPEQARSLANTLIKEANKANADRSWLK